MANEPQFQIHLKSLRTFQERVSQSKVTKAAGEAIVAKMNKQYAGQVAYWLEPAWQELSADTSISRAELAGLVDDLLPPKPQS